MAGPRADLPMRLPPLDRRMLGRIALAFVLCVGLWYAVRRPYLWTVAHGTAPVLRTVIDTRGQRAMKMDGWTLVVNSGIASPRVPGRMLSIRTDELARTGWNTLLLGALVGLTPGSRLRRGLAWLGIAVVVVWASQVATLSLEVIDRGAGLYASMDRQLIGPAAADAVALAKGYLIVAAPVIPIVVMLPIWLRRPHPGTNGRIPGRNTPCPCGSGRKFKRCCGA